MPSMVKWMSKWIKTKKIIELYDNNFKFQNFFGFEEKTEKTENQAIDGISTEVIFKFSVNV
jgi:hypothetical protein